MGTIQILREQSRREITNDENFVKNLLYYFELRAPKRLASKVYNLEGVFFFPLIINPTNISLEEPFTVEVTPTQGGGLYVEENGIVQRMLRIKGHTGFKPRALIKDAAAGARAVELVEEKSHSRLLQTFVFDALSGQKHFQYLQDAVFRTYADLKRDPESSEDTRLFFHNPRDLEFWEVVPQKFMLTRAAEKRILYEYDIELLIVGKGEAADADFSEDKSTLDEIRDGIRAAKAFVDMATGFVQDVTAAINEVTRFVKDVAKVIGGINELIDQVEAFVLGFNDLIESPLAVVNEIAEINENISATISNVAEDFRAIGPNYVNTWRRMEQAHNRLLAHPELFETDAQRKLKAVKAKQNREDAAARAQENADAGATSPATLDGFNKLGTEPLLGEIARARAELNAGRGINRYTASREIVLTQNDTLASLAAQYLGDARLWQDIALLNGMKAPFLDTQADAALAGPENPIPGVSGIGDKLVIPSFGRAAQNRALPATLGVPQTEPYEDQTLGTDYKLTPSNERQDQFDWEVDVERGAVDFKKARGVDNLTQGITTRLSVQKGTNILYKRLGLQRVVGINQIDVDTQLAQFLVLSAITEDPRVAGVQQLQFTDEGPDVLSVDAYLALRGFNQGNKVKAIGVGS